MIKLEIRYFGQGMPVPYYAYLLLAADVSELGGAGAVALVVPTSGDGENRTVAVTSGGATAAAAHAERQLDQLHQGLRKDRFPPDPAS